MCQPDWLTIPFLLAALHSPRRISYYPTTTLTIGTGFNGAQEMKCIAVPSRVGSLVQLGGCNAAHWEPLLIRIKGSRLG